MASGKKNYFRHSFFARNDIKLRLLRDSVGVGFYFYYFSLLELCGEYSCEESSNHFEFHNSVIRSLWGVNLKKSERVASVMHSVGLLFFEKRENTFYFEVPNLVKYLGKYETKLDPNTPNKRKENKRKEKEIKEKETKEKGVAKKATSEISTSEIRAAYSEAYLKRYGLTPVWGVKENSLLKKLVASIGFDEAKVLSGKYLDFPDNFHSMKKHPFSLLVSQIDQVRVHFSGKKFERLGSSTITDEKLARARELGIIS